MARSLSNLVNNLSEGIHKIKYKYRHHDNVKCFLKYTNFKNDLIEYKCLRCNKNYQQKLDEKLKERVFNRHKFF